MNYRHSYHAGNFADVLKHLVLVLCLDYLKKKEAPFFVLDSHAGAGAYDLASEHASKTREWEGGIGRLAGCCDLPADLRSYVDLVRFDVERMAYPGSPVLSARLLRPQDRAAANELHPQTFETLCETMRPFPQIRAFGLDAYRCVRAQIPPHERRGLVLIDPPFEREDEFETLQRQMREWKRRWPTGVFLVWYPIKLHLPIGALKDAARSLSLPRTWAVELLLHPRTRPNILNGCGLILFNAPYSVPQRVEALLPYLSGKMALFDAAAEWLVPEA